MDMTKKGLVQKYIVERLDKKPIPEGCMVMEWKDPNARKAIKTYAETIKDNYPLLYKDLIEKLNSYQIKGE